ncbi:LIM and SH3 domain protein Lasp [Eumeta japonica]|uniref:LIM and SH3 domain protein Lasp n=1 Tax=Eumeta variegata TaxID=151549 RepID=A0A4C1W3N6_EUMVA|nr:LIM and SH3 domain protein Lasp [Eumeta japonica]
MCLRQVADDPETLRIKANTRIISNVAYHGELEKKAQMEKQRTLNENGELVGRWRRSMRHHARTWWEPQPDNYQQQLDNYATEMLPPPVMQQAPTLPSKNQHYHAPSNQNTQDNQYRQDYYQKDYQAAQNYQHAQNYQAAQNVQNYQATQNAQNYQGAQSVQNYQTAQNYQPPQNYQGPQKDYYGYGQYYSNQHSHQTSQKIGKIQDYDPLSDGPRAPPEMRQPAATLVYNSGRGGGGGPGGAAQSSQQNRPIGRVADLDPLAGEQQPQRAPPLPPPNAAVNGQRVYVAMYDYDANDSDEVYSWWPTPKDGSRAGMTSPQLEDWIRLCPRPSPSDILFLPERPGASDSYRVASIHGRR